jgi:hypothetical protein
VICALLLAVAAGVALEQFDLVKVDVKSAAAVRELARAGCIVNGPGPDGRLLVEVPAAKRAELGRVGFAFELVREDIGGWYRQNGQDTRYHTYSQMKDTFRIIAQNNPAIAKFETIGVASNDSIIFGLKITDNPNVEEDEPELLIEGAIHGDEKCATEAYFEFAVWLVQNYGVDPDVTRWVNSREIWVVCPGNPYGHINNTRYNRNGTDCNRDYGYMWYYETDATEPFVEPEARLLAELALRNEFSFWQSGHGGTYFVSYPWSYSPYGTRDSMEHYYLAQLYSSFNGYPYAPGYRGMYQINGASKDYGYGAHGTVSWTVECCIDKTPPADSLPQIVLRERNALKAMVQNIDRGIRGRVTDSVTGQPVAARLRPLPQNFPSYCDWPGDYHRYLRPGTYSVIFEANGYQPKTISGVVVTADTVTWLDAALAPDSAAPVTLHRFIAGRGVSDVAIASTPDWCLGPRDGRRFSMGRGGMAIFDFGRQVFNLAGNDFTVYEEDGDAEGYRVEAANDWRGPWTNLGNGTGTQGFDLAGGGLSFCRYLKVVDDSTAGSGATAGVDLDAVEAIVSNQAAVVLFDRVIIDSAPGGNGDGRLDPGESAGLVLGLKNVGRQSAPDVGGTLVSLDSFITVDDAAGSFGTILPDSVRWNWADRFAVTARGDCPREHIATLRLRLGGAHVDSFDFAITVGELRGVDPIPDGPRQPALYWAYDDGDAGYPQHPDYEWVEINGVGTRLTLSDDQTVVVNLPTGFGPFRYYGTNYTQVSVCGNGWVGLGSTTSSAYSNTALPDGTMPPLFALNWDDLYPPTGGGVWYWHDAANHRFIVEFDSVPYYSNRSQFEKYQLILLDTTQAAPDGNCEFRYQYRTLGGATSSTIGCQDPTRTVAIQQLFNGSLHRGCLPFGAGRAIRYTTDYGTGIADSDAGSRPGGRSLSVAPTPWRGGSVALVARLERPGRARVGVYDAGGRLVQTLLDSGERPLGRGEYRLNWNGLDAGGRSVAAGVYLVRFEQDGVATAAKVVRAE